MHRIDISDVSGGEFDDFLHLTDVALRRKLEPERGIYLAESVKVLTRALRAGHTPRAVVTQEKWLPQLEPLLADYDVPVYVGPADAIESITGFDVHRGVNASMHRPVLPELAALVADARRVVILENIVDHTNVGAIFRSVAALGADVVLVSPECADPLYRRSVRVSMGTVFQVPWTRLTEWPRGIKELQRLGFTIAALALDERAITLREFIAENHGKVALVLGTEGHGLAPETIAVCDRTVMIPMQQGIDSLNVAAASAVALYALSESEQ